MRLNSKNTLHYIVYLYLYKVVPTHTIALHYKFNTIQVILNCLPKERVRPFLAHLETKLCLRG